MSKRSKILNALVDKLKDIDGTGTYNSNLSKNVFPRLKFYDEVDEYPEVYVTTGTEQRDYLPGGFKWAYLLITIRVYVSDDNEAELRLEEIFEDIENIIDENGNLEYDTNQYTEDIKILSIMTDEGLLSPIGVGEITLQVMYDLNAPC